MLLPIDYCVSDWRYTLVRDLIDRSENIFSEYNRDGWNRYTVHSLVMLQGYLQRLDQDIPFRCKIDEILMWLDIKLDMLPKEGYGSIKENLQSMAHNSVSYHIEHEIFEIQILTSPFAEQAGYPDLYQSRMLDSILSLLDRVDKAAICLAKCKEFGADPVADFANVIDSQVKAVIEIAPAFKLAARYIEAQHSLLDPSATHMQATYPMWNALMEAVCSN